MLTKRNNGTSTKKGPGRVSCPGIKKIGKPAPLSGSWLGQHTNPEANARRAATAKIGARQYRKQCKGIKGFLAD